MRAWKRIVLAAVVAVGLSVMFVGLDSFGASEPTQQAVNQSWRAALPPDAAVDLATFAGGCFWCIEAIYDGKRGVASAVSGYAGGREGTATYEQVTTGGTDHREAVRVRYYPSIINYSTLLDMYWRSINPTDAGGQFTDRGYHYTTAIYAHTPQQYRLAVVSKQELNQSGRFDEPIVTEILNVTTFFRAEDYHQNYSRRRTLQYKAYEQASGRKGFVERVWEYSPIS